MSGSAAPDAGRRTGYLACISLGSNIEPEANLARAAMLLRQRCGPAVFSRCYETEAVGSSGPNFLNIAALIRTPLGPEDLKAQVLAPIESVLGRVRGADKNAPRTIDLDIVVHDGQVIDQELWRRVYLALTVAELLPDLTHPESGLTICETATQLRAGTLVIPRERFFS